MRLHHRVRDLIACLCLTSWAWTLKTGLDRRRPLLFLLVFTTLPIFDVTSSHADLHAPAAPEPTRIPRQRGFGTASLRSHHHSNSQDADVSSPSSSHSEGGRRNLPEQSVFASLPSLQYPGMTAGKRSKIIIEFRTCLGCNGILRGQYLQLVLPGFRGAVAGEIELEGRNSESLPIATWDPLSGRLTLTAATRLASNKWFRVELPLAAGMTLPERGIDKHTGITISTDAANGPHQPVLLQNLVPVGSFTDSTMLDVSPLSAGTAVNLVLSFVPTMVIVAGEEITLELPNFICTEGSCQSRLFSSRLETHNHGNSTGFLSSSVRSAWSSEKRQIVFTVPVLTYERNIDPNTMVRFSVDASVGIAIGTDGLVKNDPRLRISCNAEDGPVLPVSVRNSRAIGYFSERGVSFQAREGLIPDMPVSIDLRFTSIKEVKEGEIIVIRLPGFTRISAKINKISHNNPHFEDISWNATTKALILVVKYVLRANFRQDVSIDQDEAGIRLPVDGIMKDSPDLTISTNAEDGPVEMLRIENNPSVGALLDLALAFDPPKAATVASIHLRFRPSMQMEEYDAIEVHLPSFDGPEFGVIDGNQILNLNNAGNMPFHGVWSNSQPDSMLVLMVDCGKLVTANTSFHLAISSSVGIRTPREAIMANQQTFKISSNAKAASVIPQGFTSVQRVGAFVNELGEGMTIKFSGEESSTEELGPGSFCKIELGFTVDMDILTDEVIEVSLPGFSVENTTVPDTCDVRMSTVESSFVSRGSWNLTSQILYLTTSVHMYKDSLVEISIPGSFGLRLPLNGLEADQHTLEISGSFAAGDVILFHQ